MSFKPVPIVDMKQWQLSPRSKRKKRKKSKSEEEIELSNSFEALSSDEMDGVETEANTPKKEESRKMKIPPLVIYNNIDNHVQTLSQMKEDLTDEITLKCKSNRIIFYTKNVQDYKKMKEKITAAQVQYHTYSLDNEKPVTTILKGLPSNITVEEILQDLAEKKLNVKDVKQFTKNVEVTSGCFKEFKLPIFCVRFSENTKVSDFKKYKSVCFCKVSWEKNLRRKIVTQCFKCQSFGHIAQNCFKTEVCANCAEKHNTKNCQNPKNFKCANCSGNHPSYDVECDYYKRIITAKKNVLKNRFDSYYDNEYMNHNSVNTSTQPTVIDTRNTKPGASLNRPKYSEVVDLGNNNNNTKENEEKNDDMGSLFRELMMLFKGINFSKILAIVKKLNYNLKKCKDSVSKFGCLIECIAEYFD